MKTTAMKSRLTALRRFRIFRKTIQVILGLLTLLAMAGPLSAGNLYLPNFSFESPVTPFAGPQIDSWQKTAQPAGFDPNIFGAWDNLAGIFVNTPATNADHIANADGGQLAYLFAYPQVGFFQDYNSTDWSNAAPSHGFNAKFEPGKSYQLSVGVTTSTQAPLTPGSTLQLALYYRDNASNLVIVTATTVTYDPNVFTNSTHLIDYRVNVPAVKTNDAWAGRNIGIQFMSTVAPELLGGVWDLDNVRLTEAIEVPNFSFELPGTPFADPRVDAWQKASQPGSFDPNIFGDWNNLAGVFQNAVSTNADHIENCDGNQLAYLFSYPQVGMFQDFNSIDWSNTVPTHAFNATFKAGKSYTLTVGLTSSREAPLTPGATLQLSLYYRDGSNNLVTVAATNVAYDTNLFANVTRLVDFQVKIPEVKAADAWAGRNIGIQFMSTVAPELIGGVWDLDNVRLTEVVATKLSNVGRANGQTSFTLLSEPGLPFEIQAATNLVAPTWTSLATFTNTTGAFPFVDTTATNINQRFYRAHRL
jgi:hypothetical protein